MTRPAERPAQLARRLRWSLRRSLQMRMAAAFLAAAVLTIVTVAVISYDQARDAVRRSVEERLSGIANRRVLDVDAYVNAQADLIEFVAGIPALAEAAVILSDPDSPMPARGAAEVRVGNVLDSALVSGFDVVEMMLLSGVGGRVLVSTDHRQVGSYHVADLYFTRGLTKPYTQNVYASPQTGRPTMTTAAPLRDTEGKTVAVLAAHLDLQKMDQLLAPPPGTLPFDAYLVNRHSDFVSANRFGRADYLRGVRSTAIDSALAGKNGTALYRNYAGVPVIGAYRWLPDRELAIIVETPQAAVFRQAGQVLTTILVTGAVAVLVLTIAAYVIAGRVAQPVLSVAAAARRVAEGDFEAQAPVQTQDEVGLMATSFNEMTSRLRALYQNLNEQVDATQDALHALRESQGLLQSIVDNSATMVCVLTPDRGFLLVNRRFEEAFGIARAQVTDTPLAALLPADVADIIGTATRKAIDSCAAVERELQVSSSAGPRTYHTVFFPLLDAAGVPYATGLIASDLTERQRAEEERRQLETQIQHTQKLESLGVMAGGIAHDFNNILGAVLANAEMALRDADDPAQVQQCIEQVVLAARRASHLTRQMLAYAGKASFGSETLDLNGIVREMSDLTMVTVPKKVAFVLQLSDAPAWMVADPAQISQVVLNLVTNAAEAIGDRTGQVAIRTERVRRTLAGPRTRGSDTDVRLTVRDTGTGMSTETRRRIFEPFFTTKSSGRGLGLAAVLGIVKAVGGRLDVHSELGVGTTFELLFPGAPAPRGPQQEVQDEPAVSRQPGRGSVLVIDDESMLRNIVARALGQVGFEVIEAVDGSAGVAEYLRHRDRISAIVLDMTMPGMSGPEVLQVIRKHDRQVPVIIASGYDAEGTAAEGATDASLSFLQKPFGVADLLAIVTKVTNRPGSPAASSTG
ncbi:MAG: ATP-binding protein [Gemmatimonadaceae bacterium]